MKISVQSAGVTDCIGVEAGYAAIAKAGFTAIDWNAIEHGLSGEQIRKLEYKGSIFEKPLDEIMAYYAQELAVIRDAGLAISQCHAPFPAYIPGRPEVLDYMIDAYKKCIEVCEQIGCGNIIIHGISLQPDDKENMPETIEVLNWKLYESLIPALQKCTHVTVCLENLFSWQTNVGAVEGTCSDPHEAVRFIDTLNEKAGREAFGLCLDTGHLLLLRKDVRTYTPILGKRIKALHIHDNDGVTDRHYAPLTGKFDWAGFCDALRQVGYEGDLSFETFAQTRKVAAFDKVLLPAWLELICKTGERFRDHIQK